MAGKIHTWGLAEVGTRGVQSAELDDGEESEIMNSQKAHHKSEKREKEEKLIASNENYKNSQEITAVVALLKACGKQKDLCKGSRLHVDILKQGLLKQNIYVGNTLVNMYVKCGEFGKARQVFDELPVRDVVTWTALIAGYAQHGCGEKALNCFERMRNEGISPNAVTFACILKACGSIGASQKGKEVHAEIVKEGLLAKNSMLGSALVDMYAKCGALAKAREVFDELPFQSVVSWNALIAGYVHHRHGEEALNCFERMRSEGFSPDAVTFACILKACGSIGAAEKGEKIHAEIVRKGLLRNDIVLGNTLVDMYAKCGALERAQQVFDELSARDIVSWNALITGYMQHDYGEQALKCYDRMQSEGLSPDVVTFTCILKVCGGVGAAQKGEEVQAKIVREGLLGRNSMLGTALVNMYATCGALVKAQQVFDELSVRDVVTWTVLIAGYTQHGHGEDALNCFEQMQSKGLSPNAVTFSCILKACGIVGAAEKGEEIHAEIVREGLLGKDIVLGTALVDMYASFGALEKAQEVFVKLHAQDVVSWTALIAGYAQHGYTGEALKCFGQMQSKGLSPNSATYTCMVDLFGRAGDFDKVIAVIKKIQYLHDLPMWFVLLSACGTWGNANVGRLAFEHAVHLDGNSAVAYVCMSNIYAAAGMQEEAEKVEALRMKNKAWKKPARCWWIDLSGKVHSFCVGDETHSESKNIYAKLEEICHQISQKGYCPNLRLLSQDVLDDVNEDILCAQWEVGYCTRPH